MPHRKRLARHRQRNVDATADSAPVELFSETPPAIGPAEVTTESSGRAFARQNLPMQVETNLPLRATFGPAEATAETSGRACQRQKPAPYASPVAFVQNMGGYEPAPDDN